MSDNKIKARGDCLCGAIQVSVDGPVARMAQCHCRDCQRSSGTGHMSLIFLGEDSVTINGEATAYASTTDSGNTNALRPGVVAIPVGIFEDRSWFKPDVVVYSKNRDEWDISDAATPSFEMMPPA